MKKPGVAGERKSLSRYQVIVLYETMNSIALICDDAYVFPTLVTIQSIIESVKESEKLFEIYVCSFGLSIDNVEKLRSMSQNNVKVFVRMVDESLYADKLSRVNQKTHVSKTALIKLELPQVFHDKERIVYLDSDIIVKADISELFDLDMQEYYIAATFEFLKYWEQVHYVFKPFRYTGQYINSGVLVMNLAKMRDDNISEKFWEYKLNSCKTTSMDQETINEVCKNKTYPLTNLYNFNPVFYSDINLKPFEEVFKLKYPSIESFLDDVKIVHYVGKSDKPWKYKSAHLGEYWLKYYNLLPQKPVLIYSEEVIEKRSAGKVLSDQIKEHGILGTFHYMLYKIGIRL